MPASIVSGIGMTVVTITGGIDISVGSFVAMGCNDACVWMMEKVELAQFLAVLIVLATGIIFGLVQGFSGSLYGYPAIYSYTCRYVLCKRYDSQYFQGYDQYYQRDLYGMGENETVYSFGGYLNKKAL